MTPYKPDKKEAKEKGKKIKELEKKHVQLLKELQSPSKITYTVDIYVSLIGLRNLVNKAVEP